MKIENYLTYINNEEDKVHLTSKLLPVNMRLFNSSSFYKDLIIQQCEYIKLICKTTLEGYSKPFGMSSANVGLAHNIIAYIKDRNSSYETCEIMINPKIIDASKSFVLAKSNCGSIRLDESITIPRNEIITVSYFDIGGNHYFKDFNRKQCGLTIQHEIEHNLGILITDKK